MIDKITSFLVEAVGREICVLLCAMLPIIELRGAIPLGVGLGLPWWQNYILAVIGNMLPVPFILLFISKVLQWMKGSRVKFFCRIADWLDAKAEKNRPKIEKYSFWGLCLFIGIPLPVTGAWTGALVAATIKMKFWKALLSAFLGVLISATIMTLGSYGVVAVFKYFA